MGIDMLISFQGDLGGQREFVSLVISLKLAEY